MTTKEQKQEAMFSLIESWQSSGQTQHEFCKAQGLAYSAFHYWYKKYRQRYQAGSPSAFVPVRVKSSLPGSLVAELILPDGKRLNFYQSIDAGLLRALLS